MKLNNYIEKVKKLILLSTKYKQYFINPNLYLFNLEILDLSKSKKILFAFNNITFMHFGDHLFFLPLIKVMQDSGYNVDVLPTPLMAPVFNLLKFNLVDNPDYSQYDLIISRVEMMDEFINYKSLLVNVSKNLSMPIAEQLITEFKKYFHLMSYIKPDISVFKQRGILNKFNLSTNKKLILFNVYCDSSAFLITKAKKNKLINFVKEYAKNPNYEIVFVGSEADKLNDKFVYDFQFIDLRGKTNIVDLFNIVYEENVEYYIGFDALIMHIFSFFEKRSFVIYRGRLLKKQNQMLRNFHINLFSNQNFVTLLN